MKVIGYTYRQSRVHGRYIYKLLFIMREPTIICARATRAFDGLRPALLGAGWVGWGGGSHPPYKERRARMGRVKSYNARLYGT